LPTLASVIGVKNFGADDIDGASQWDFLRGKTEQAVKTNYIIHAIDAEAYYKDEWKLIVPTDGEAELYQIMDDPTENHNVIAQFPEVAEDLFKEYESFPRGEIVDDPLWKTFMDMDKFGGEEDREPYAGIEGKNEGPLHPIYYILPILILLIFLFIRWRVNRRKRKKRA